MARRRIIISSSGGIAAGTPFTLGGGLFVQQVAPPVANTQRFALLEPVDAFQSIVAPGTAGAAHTFVMGEDAEDSANGARSLLIGYKLRANTGGGATQADDQVLLGNTIQLPAASRNCAGLVAIGSNVGFTAFLGVADSFGSSVVVGNLAGLKCVNAGGGDASNAVAIGAGAIAHGGSVVIGSSALDSGLTAVVIGQGATAGLQAIAIGLNAIATADRCISIGDRARAGSADTIVIGWFADGANSDSSIVIGKQANSSGKNANIMLGRNASVALDNFMQIGGDQTYPINEIRFGAGYTAATGGNTYTFGITTVFDGAGNNLAGNGLLIRSGLGTGSWANTQNLGIDLQVGLVQGGGSTQQPYTSVIAIRHSDLNVALWGGMAAPFSSGKGVLFIKNAATNPTVAAVVGGGILSVQGGELHFLSSAGVDTALTPGGGGGGITGGGTAGKVPLFSGATAIGNSVVTETAGVWSGLTGVSFGGTPAATGNIRFTKNTVNITVRNAAGSGDLQVFGSDSANGLFFGGSGAIASITLGPGLGWTTVTSAAFTLASGVILQVGNSATGGGAALLGNNCPAITAAAPSTWLQMMDPSGNTVYVPAWK